MSYSDLQVPPTHYYEDDYDTIGRFASYWQQINLIRSRNPARVLEVGIGNSFTRDYLSKRGIDVTGVDIDTALDPDVAATVTSLPFETAEFDVVACFEVLEHLPFEYFRPALSEIGRVASDRIFISIPDARRAYRFECQLPKIGQWRYLMEIPRIMKPKHCFDGQHHWELNKRGFGLKRVVKAMDEAGVTLLRTFRLFEVPRHRFFELS